MSDKYIIDEGQVVRCKDLITWAKWYEDADRRVAFTIVAPFEVVTFFTALDMGGKEFPDAPVLWETMVTPGNDGERYTSLEAAKAGHDRWVDNMLKKACVKNAKAEAVVVEEGKKL